MIHPWCGRRPPAASGTRDAGPRHGWRRTSRRAVTARWPLGRLAWLALAPDDLALATRAVAGVDVPAVIAVTGPRTTATDDLLADQDLIVLVISTTPSPASSRSPSPAFRALHRTSPRPPPARHPGRPPGGDGRGGEGCASRCPGDERALARLVRRRCCSSRPRGAAARRARARRGRARGRAGGGGPAGGGPRRARGRAGDARRVRAAVRAGDVDGVGRTRAT